MRRKNKGFTLVELIVVIVILAILAAILVPALLGYIDKAKEKKDMLKAKNFLTATQAVLTDYYATGTDPKKDAKHSGDANTKFAKEVRKLADDDPYMVLIGVGDERDEDITEHDKYTAYFVMYWESPDKDPLFFNGSDWSLSYPWAKNESKMENNYFSINGTKKCLTFIFVANKPGSSNPWTAIHAAIEKGGHGYAAPGGTKK